MQFQFSVRPLPIVIMLVGVTVAMPAAAQKQAPEPPLVPRDAQKTEAPAPAVKLKIEGVRDGLQIRVLSKEQGPATESATTASCNQDCEVKLPAGSYTLVANQGEPQKAPGADVRAPLRLTMSEPDTALRRLGTVLGVGGIIAAAMGSYLTIGALVARDGANQEFAGGLNEFFFLGLAGVGAGAGLMFGGFSLAAANRTPSMDVGRIPNTVQRRAPTGMSVSFSGTF